MRRWRKVSLCSFPLIFVALLLPLLEAKAHSWEITRKVVGGGGEKRIGGRGWREKEGGKQERENCQVSSEPAVEKSSTKMGFGHVEMGPLTHDCLRTV